jgi:hypothetical protein
VATTTLYPPNDASHLCSFGFNTLNTTLMQIPYGTFIALM